MWFLLALLTACGSPVERDAYSGSQTPDGCSGGSPWAKELFANACYNHDVCYRVGESRFECDRNFLREMERICGSLNFPCRAEARVMYAAVRVNPRGQEVFDKRHKKEAADAE